MVLFISHLLSFLFPQSVFAETIGGCGDGALCSLGSRTELEFGAILSQIIQFIFVIAVILALGFMVYGGIRWLTSGGDKDSVAAARGTIVAALVGLIVIFLSYFILNFVLLFLTGSGISGINVPRIVDGNIEGDGTGGPNVRSCAEGGNSVDRQGRLLCICIQGETSGRIASRNDGPDDLRQWCGKG